MKRKYNLTKWQRVYIFFLAPLWFIVSMFYASSKSWHEVKSGMEKHNHKMNWIFFRDGQYYVRCSHDGCNKIEVLDVPELY